MLGSTLPKGRGRKMTTPISAIHTPHHGPVRGWHSKVQRARRQRPAVVYSHARPCRQRRDQVSSRRSRPRRWGRAEPGAGRSPTCTRRLQRQAMSRMARLKAVPTPYTGTTHSTDSTSSSTAGESSPCSPSRSARLMRSPDCAACRNGSGLITSAPWRRGARAREPASCVHLARPQTDRARDKNKGAGGATAQRAGVH